MVERLCACHQEKMQRNGPGRWRCYVKRREYRKAAEARYRHSPKGYIATRRSRLRALRALWEARAKEMG